GRKEPEGGSGDGGGRRGSTPSREGRALFRRSRQGPAEPGRRRPRAWSSGSPELHLAKTLAIWSAACPPPDLTSIAGPRARLLPTATALSVGGAEPTPPLQLVGDDEPGPRGRRRESGDERQNRPRKGRKGKVFLLSL
ncbi:unnamed protein product, partial [Urochloa humidicola]